MEQQLLGKPAGSVTRSWRHGAVLALLLSYFGLFGMLIGVLGTLWNEIITALRLSQGTFGAAQMVWPLVAIALMLQGGALGGRLGNKRLALAGLATLGLAMLALAGIGGIGGFLVALALGGAGNGLIEIAMNSATLDWEQATGRSVMNLMHAVFSGGAMLGALAAGSLLEIGWNYSQILVALAALYALACVATLPTRYPPTDRHTSDATSPIAALWLLIGQPALITLAVLCLLGIVGESIPSLWSTIYLREIGASPLVGGAGLALFNATMVVGRLLNAPLVDRMGPRVSLTISGIGLAAATALLLLPGVSFAVIAFAALGLAVAGIVPTTLVAAGRASPANHGVIVGAIMSVAYAGFIICPPLIGWLADQIGLQLALLSIGLSGLAVSLLALRVVSAPPAIETAHPH